MLFPTLAAKFTTIAEARRQIGVSYFGGINTSSKMMKNQKISGHYTYIIYLAPAKTSGHNVCPFSTPECRNGCLATSGRAAMEIISGGNRIQQSRIRKTNMLCTNPTFTLALISAEIDKAKAKAARDGFAFSVRLNGTSDIDYTKIRLDGKNIFELHPDVTFYDYTKGARRFENKPANHHLTLSYTGRNWAQCEALLNAGGNVAMIFNIDKKASVPERYRGYPVIDGDITDLRVDEAKGTIVGLHWKKIADRYMNNTVKRSIFVIQPDDEYLNVKLKKKYGSTKSQNH